MSVLFISIFFLFTIIAGAIRAKRAWYAWKLIERESLQFIPHSSKPKNSRLIILLPCLNEQEIVNSTLDYMCSMLGVHHNNILFVPITGESETFLKEGRIPEIKDSVRKLWTQKSLNQLQLDSNLFHSSCHEQIFRLVESSVNVKQLETELIKIYLQQPSTWEIIDQWIIDHPEFSNLIYRIHDSNKNASKATKLNYAVQQLRTTHKEWLNDPTAYLGIYDFDSKPEKKTFSWLMTQIDEMSVHNEELPTIFQQPAITLGSEMDQLSPFSSSFIASIWHLERSMGAEAFSHTKRWKKRFLRGCVGTGLFIRTQDLDEIGEFPVNSDDIAFGYRIALMRKKRHLIPLMNFMQPVPTTMNLIKQFHRILIGIFSVGQEMDYVENHISPISNKRWKMFTTYFHVLVPTIQLLLFLITVLLAGILTSITIALVVFSLLYLIYMCIFLNYVHLATCIRNKFNQPLDVKIHEKLLVSLIGALHLPLFRTLMMTYYLVRVMPNKERQKQLLSEKTDRREANAVEDYH